MRAVCWEGKERIQVETLPDPVILNPRDAIIKVTTTAICGSDLHIYDGYIPTMQKGDVLGHEFMGEVVEVGKEITRLKVGDRVVVPFTIACGHCYFCKEQLWSLCDNSNPNAWMAEKLYGYSASGLFGYSHMYGGYPGGQAEYARVPFADIGPLKVPDTRPLPLGHLPNWIHGRRQLPDQAGRHGGGVGLRTGRSVRDQKRLPPRRRARHRDRLLRRRLELASSQGRAETLNYEEVDVLDALRHMTGSAGTAGRSSSSKTSIATVNRSLHWARATNCLRRAESRRHCQTGTRTQACFWPPTPHR